MEFQEFKNTLKRIYNEHIRYHLKRILLCLFLSVCIAESTSAIAWLLDPAVKKIFIDKNSDYGASWRVLRIISLVDQINIKAQRIRNLQSNISNKIDEDQINEKIFLI